ncbi:MAG TPA: FAD-dependent oxidoreductase, partial [Thermoanaerobaculia bacterium]|nr:FAD-dependent oxidoreductase [Thermoanaerobaculia bacterium]
MSETIEVKIPDLGGAEEVDVVEVLVEPGQRIERDAGLVTLESDKASMDAPSPAAGTVREIALARGDKVSEGDLILTLEVEEETPSKSTAQGEEESSEAKDEPSEASSREGSKAKARAAGAPGETPAEPRARASAPGAVDLVVLGAGPGGYTAAFRAADLGLKVVLIERYPTLGGVCLNVGCIPSKALLHSAKVIDEAAAMAEHGISFGSPAIDPAKLSRFKQGVVDRLTGGLGRLSEQRKIEVVQGTATLTSAHGLRVELAAGGSRDIDFAKAILAAGSRPIQIAGIPYGDKRVMDSTAALDLV